MNNRADASFCLECGAPLDEDSLASLPPALLRPPEPAPAPRLHPLSIFNPLRWSNPVRIIVVAALVVAVITTSVNSSEQADLDLYSRAKQAQNTGHWHEAAQLFKSLADHAYYDATAHYNTVKAEANNFEAMYGAGSHAETLGYKVEAAYYYDRANAIEPGYYAVDVARDRLRRANGRILYRITSGDRAHLYVAEADGGKAQYLPNSRGDSLVLATSPDGNFVVFADHHDGPLHLYVADLAHQQVREVVMPSLQGAGRYPQQFVSVALFDAGASMLIVDGGGFGYSNSAGGSNSAVLYTAHLADLSHSQITPSYIGFTDDVAWPNYRDQIFYYTDNADLHGYDIHSGKPTFTITPPEHVYYMQSLPDGKLLYMTYATVAATLYRLDPRAVPYPTQLIEVFEAQRPYGTLYPHITVSPNGTRLLLSLLSRSKGMVYYLLDISSEGAAKQLRYSESSPDGSRLLDASFLPDGTAALLYTIAPPNASYSPPRVNLTVLNESSFGYFFTHNFLTDATDQSVKSTSFVDGDHVAYLTAQNGASREFTVGDIIIARVDRPDQKIRLAARPSDDVGNAPLATLLRDDHTLLYAGNVNGEQGVYINDTDNQRPLLVMPEAADVWPLGSH